MDRWTVVFAGRRVSPVAFVVEAEFTAGAQSVAACAFLSEFGTTHGALGYHVAATELGEVVTIDRVMRGA